MGEPDVTANDGVMTYSDTTKDGGVGIDRDVIFQDRVTRDVFGLAIFIVFEVLRTECNTLIQDDMRANDGRFADDNTRSVVNTEIVSYLRCRVNIYSCAAMRQFRQHTRNTRHAELVQHMGGTVSGVGRALKERNFTIEVIAVEPASSPVLTQGHAGPHKIQGIGANFVPDTYQAGFIDRVLTVTDDDAINAARTLAKDHGLLVGISSGAAYTAALQLTQQPEYKDKTIVVLLPDTGERYLSVL